jgi:hypothetical protein
MVNGRRIREGPLETVNVAYVLANKLRRRVREARRNTRRMNLPVETIDDAHLVPAFDKRIDQMRANESGTTNDHDAQV